MRGFERDVRDARRFIDSGLVDADTLRQLVAGIPEPAFAGYPTLSHAAVLEAVEAFVRGPR